MDAAGGGREHQAQILSLPSSNGHFMSCCQPSIISREISMKKKCLQFSLIVAVGSFTALSTTDIRFMTNGKGSTFSSARRSSFNALIVLDIPVVSLVHSKLGFMLPCTDIFHEQYKAETY